MPEVIDQAPSPRSHIKTLMRIGYTLNSAVSDIIDNSIAAGSRQIDIFSAPGQDDPTISIVDDGCGMSRDELIENMRIGCKDPLMERQKGDLGRFGSGMKTASFSQARQLTVISRTKGCPLVAARWDIDRIEDSDTWCLEVLSQNEIERIPGAQLDELSESGTQVVWGKLTCLEKGSHSLSRESDLAARLADLRKYLALHFHRFMSGRSAISFSLNRSEIQPVDPFMTNAKGYQEGPSEKMRCKGGYIEIRTHVLPHFKNMNRAQMEALGGADGIAQKQGIYIYREKRLISAGGWRGLARSSQLGALARVQVDVPASLDNSWSTDVKKASLQMPPKVRRELKKFLSDPIKRSKRVHKYRGKIETANQCWKICDNEATKTITYQIHPNHALLLELAASSTKEQQQLLFSYLKELAEHLPINHIYEKMSERPNDIAQSDLDLPDLKSILDKVFA